jgi:DNA-directed RNA polymerase specialized sigma24 family protein
VVLELRFIHDLDVEATAEVLGMSPEATRALTYRALTRLRGSVTHITTTPRGSDTR